MTLREAVYEVLKDEPETRNDDYKLWAEVIIKKSDTAFYVQEAFLDVLENFYNYDFPPFESVSRVRRYVQDKHPELKPPETARRRKIKEEQYRNEYRK